jgi:hypothetical protein
MMDHAITVGMVVWASVAVLGVIGVIGVCLWILSIFADAFKH